MSELKPDLLSISSINPWAQHDSSPRGTMLTTSHLTQAISVEGRSPRRCQSGTEREFGKYTFKIKLPCDAEIIKNIPKYRPGIGRDSIKYSPSSLLVYEDVETKEVGCIELVGNSQTTDVKHQQFGFTYKYNERVYEELVPGKVIPKDTVIADSPNIDNEGNYSFGLEANIALMGVPGVIEDGVVVSRSFLEKIKTKGIEKRVVSWGKKIYPLNLYGDSTNFKPFPEIGQKIRSDGLLFALRSHDELLSPIEMAPEGLENPDYIFDKLVYARPNAKVIDITVHSGNSDRISPTPVGMEEQAKKYNDNHKIYYNTILSLYAELLKARGKDLKITREFQRIIVNAMVNVDGEENELVKKLKLRDSRLKKKVKKTYRRKDIDDWRVEITFEYDLLPSIGFKVSECHGG